MEKIKLPVAQSQELLLRALIGKDSEALMFYLEWIESVNFTNYIDGESYALLPALYKRLESLGFTDQNMNKYKGVYRKSFFKNSLHLFRLRSIAKKLNDKNIPFTVLKGIPLIINYYDDIGARSMNDIDMVVDKENLKEVITILNELGYKSDCNYDIYENIQTRHSYSFRNENNYEIDLYWIPLPVSYRHIDVHETKEIKYQDIFCNMLLAENFIIQVCLHGAKWNQVFNIRWLTDIHIILKTEKQIDWQLLINKLTGTRLLYTFHLVFKYFNDVSEIQIPEWVVNELRTLGDNKINRKYASKRLIASKSVFGLINWYWYNYHFRDRNFFYRVFHYFKHRLMMSKYDRYSDLFKAFIKKYILKSKAAKPS